MYDTLWCKRGRFPLLVVLGYNVCLQEMINLMTGERHAELFATDWSSFILMMVL
uniref:Uncharacterized protein n=1 Tax=Schistosoma mansoni TaxID=6183 RepID=A0AA82N7T6_SCHMA